VRQADPRRQHLDNTFYNEPQGRAAELISTRSFGGRCFFCNSGAEAVEAAIKLARLHGQPRGRYKVITMLDSFHGRTFGAITATGQEKYHKGYLPLLPGISHVPFNDFDALQEAVDEETCAVMLEPIQGEGGVNVAAADYLRRVRELCDRQGLLLILDEVQTGVGRTGEWFCYQHYGVEPDIMTLAKALGGGFPVGAIVARPEVADSLVPGTHASTFGGNPLACAAVAGVFEAIEQEGLLERCRESSRRIFARLRQMQERYDIIKQVRGIGLMVGIELHAPGQRVFEYCLKNFVRINCTHERVLRLLPAMNVPGDALEHGLQVLEDGIRAAQNAGA